MWRALSSPGGWELGMPALVGWAVPGMGGGSPVGVKGVHLQTSWLGREGTVGTKEAGTKDVSSFAGLAVPVAINHSRLPS